MACKGTLVVENDADGKLVRWQLLCEGKCKDPHKYCETRFLHLGGTSLMYYCACEEDREDEDVPACRFQVYVREAEGVARVSVKCVGRCGKHREEPCRAVVVKEYKLLPVNQENELELNQLKVHTVRHIACTCLSEIV
jgi:hypothetical protein